MLDYNVTSQIVEPLDLIPLATAKAQCRIEPDRDEEDELIQTYIEAAVESASRYIGSPVNSSEVVIYADAYARKMFFPVHPVTAVSEVNYVDPNGDVVTLPVGEVKPIRYDRESRMLFLTQFEVLADEEAVIEVKAVSGYTPDTLPKNILRAMLLEIGDMYTYREDRKEITNKASEALLRQYRIYG